MSLLNEITKNYFEPRPDIGYIISCIPYNISKEPLKKRLFNLWSANDLLEESLNEDIPNTL